MNEKAPIKKTHAGNFEIIHPYFKDYLFKDWYQALSYWERFVAGDDPLNNRLRSFR